MSPDRLIPDGVFSLPISSSSHLPEPKRRMSPSGANAATSIAEPIITGTLLDDKVHEYYLEVIKASDRKVVTAIEVLSPTNKIAGADGLDGFLEKRDQVMRSSTHWVEIDLLRAGISPILAVACPEHEYLVHISPNDRRPNGFIWAIRLNRPLPVVRIPLRPKDGDTPLDLQTVLDTAYDRAGYDTEID